MNRTEERFDPSVRVIPKGWMRPQAQPHEHAGRQANMREGAAQGHDTPHRWMSTLEAPLRKVRACVEQVFEELDAALAYLYESEDKVVIRWTRPGQQIRVELRPLEDDRDATRIVVVVSADSQVDRHASGRIVEAVERKLRG